MYCPQCSSEYREGFSQCSDCDVPLVHELPVDEPHENATPAGSVVVFSSSVPGETEMIAAALNEEGITGFVRRSIAGGVQLTMLDGGFTPGQELALAVPCVSEARARELIGALRHEAMVTDYEPTGLGGPSKNARLVARVLLALLLIPLGFGALAVLGTVVAALLR